MLKTCFLILDAMSSKSVGIGLVPINIDNKFSKKIAKQKDKSNNIIMLAVKN